jgi:hypothetical protein
MAPECSFILPNGKKCRCAATRKQTLCRHHAPKPAVAGPPPVPKWEIYSNLSRWRRLRAEIPWMPPAEIPARIYEILHCLIDRGDASPGHISDLTAGRLIRALLNRLGDVPFPDPELAPPSTPVSSPRAAGANPLATSSSEMRELKAMLAALGMPASQSPMHQSPARVNQ